MLEAGTTIRNVSVCIVILLGSYIASTFVNASPATRPSLMGPRTRAVIVTPPPENLETPVEFPAPAPEVQFPPHSENVQSL
jgi:hypothetical protein